MTRQRGPKAGYGHPPTQHQFQKGKSGNPKGRPKKSPLEILATNMDANSAEVILEEARRAVPVRENGKIEDMSMLRALCRQLYVSGLRGNPRALVEALKLIGAAEQALNHDKRSSWTSVNGLDFSEMSEEDIVDRMRELISTGRAQLPDGYELVEEEDDHSDLA